MQPTCYPSQLEISLIHNSMWQNTLRYHSLAGYGGAGGRHPGGGVPGQREEPCGVPPPSSIVLRSVGASCRSMQACMQDERDRQRNCGMGSHGRCMHQLLLARAEQLRLRHVHGYQHGRVDGGELCYDSRERGCAPGGQAGGVLQPGVGHSAGGGGQEYCPVRGVSSLHPYCLALSPH
jgi:hypothetical protein